MQVAVVVALEREQDGSEQPAAHAPRFPGRKDEGWWLVVGDPKANSLLAIKRVNLGKAAKVRVYNVEVCKAAKVRVYNVEVCVKVDVWVKVQVWVWV